MIENDKSNFSWHFFEIGFLLLVFYLPFQLALNISSDIDLASGRVLIPALFLFWLTIAALSKKRIFISSFQGFGLIIFLVLAGLSLLGAAEPAWGWRKLLFFLSLFPIYFMAVSFVTRKDNLKKLLDLFILVAAISAALGLIQFLAQFFIGGTALTSFYSEKIGPLFWGQSFAKLVVENQSWFVNIGGQTLARSFGLFPDPHMLAFFLGLILPLAVALFLLNKKSNLKLFAICVLIFVVLLLTFSRGGYFGLFASLAVIFLLAWRFLTKQKKFLVLAGITLAIIFLLVLGQPVISRFVSSFLLNEGSSLSRLEIWRQSFNVFLAHPVLGVGLGNYAKEVDPLASYRSPITSHNFYLDLAAETGFFGLLVWFILIFGSFWLVWRSLKKTETGDSFLPAVKIGLAGSLVYFFVHSFFETAIFNPTVLPFLLIILALINTVCYYGNLA